MKWIGALCSMWWAPRGRKLRQMQKSLDASHWPSDHGSLKLLHEKRGADNGRLSWEFNGTYLSQRLSKRGTEGTRRWWRTWTARYRGHHDRRSFAEKSSLEIFRKWSNSQIVQPRWRSKWAFVSLITFLRSQAEICVNRWRWSLRQYWVDNEKKLRFFECLYLCWQRSTHKHQFRFRR